jgi:hypothetical protein
LGTLVLERLDEPHPSFFIGGYFEMWLSRLAEPQPDLPDHRNASNWALFLRITEVLHRVMVEREREALAEDPPQWLTRLVRVAHAEKLTMVTFNYDTLLEKATDECRIYDWEQRILAGSLHTVNMLPPPPYVPGFSFGPSPANSFTLLKLHGSIDNYWVAGDTSGATINRYNTGDWSHPLELDEKERSRRLPNRTPFIVPPAAAKSSFYNNPVTRQIWQWAAQALETADTISLVGYSLPATDLATSGMLADAISVSRPRMEVVNLCPDPVVDRLLYLGAGRDDIPIRDLEWWGRRDVRSADRGGTNHAGHTVPRR